MTQQPPALHHDIPPTSLLFNGRKMSENGLQVVPSALNGTSDAVLVKNHPIYWFDDGSLILDVETQRFKVHHTLVTRHSKFLSAESGVKKWEGMSSPQGQHSSGGPGHDGSLNHVIIQPTRQVRAEDIEALLRHLYHDLPLDTDASFSHVISLLRVSSPQQLDFPNIHQAACRIFEGSFPRNPENFTHTHPLHDALPIAKELKLHLVTKAIFYSLVSTTEFDVPSDDLEGPESAVQIDPSGSQLNVPHDQQEPEKASSQNSPRQLSPQDAQTCLSLMNSLISHFTPILFTAPAASHMECTDVFAGSWMSNVIQPAIDTDGVYRPLETLQRIKEIDWEKLGLCSSCVIEKKQEWSEEQRSIWKLMDSWLDLPEPDTGLS